MTFQNMLIWAGALILVFSWYLGDWSIWLGAPLIFIGIILKYVDKGGTP